MTTRIEEARARGEAPIEWQVWLADGRTLTSLTHAWPDVPDGILVMRWWGDRRNGVVWGDGVYGHPQTLKQAGWVADHEFARVLREAQAMTMRPSDR